MKYLLEIAGILTKKKVKKIEILDEHALNKSNSMFVSFYDALLDGKFKTDRDAAAFFYDSSPTDDKYRQLKSRFRRRLLNTLFFIDINQPYYKNYDRAYHNAQKEWALVQILLLNGAQNSALALTKQILSVSQKFGFFDLQLSCARLFQQHAARKGSAKELERYRQLGDEAMEKRRILDQNTYALQQIHLLYHASFSGDPSCLRQIEGHLRNIEANQKELQVAIGEMQLYLAKAFTLEVGKDYEALITTTRDHLEDASRQTVYYPRELVDQLRIRLMSGYLHTRLDRARDIDLYSQQWLRSANPGSSFWLQLHEYLFLIALHADDLKKAGKLLSRVEQVIKSKKQGILAIEKWKIFKYYLWFLAAARNLRKIEQPPAQLAQTLNNGLFLRKNYPYLYFHTLLLQIGFLLLERSYDKAHHCAGLLKQWTQKHHRKKKLRRPMYCAELCETFINTEEPYEGSPKSEKRMRELSGTPMHYLGNTETLEVIPFQDLLALFASLATSARYSPGNSR